MMLKKPFLHMIIVSTLLFSGCLITGKVVNESGIGVLGVTVNLGGVERMTTTTNSNGYYQFGVYAGAYTVTPSGNATPASTGVVIIYGKVGDLNNVPLPIGGVDFIIDSINAAGYFPLALGNYWTYENAVDPSDTYTKSVFQSLTHEGNPALKFGIDANNHVIVYNDGNAMTIYAVVENGASLEVGYPLTIGEIVDGSFFNHGEPTNFTLLRMWDNLDPALIGTYNIDPSLQDLLLWVTYDSRYAANLHNTIVESNLPAGVSIPDYAVTQLEWYQMDIGEIVNLDIDAATGTSGVRYELTDYKIVQ